jgi:hypothetical protein
MGDGRRKLSRFWRIKKRKIEWFQAAALASL